MYQKILLTCLIVGGSLHAVSAEDSMAGAIAELVSPQVTPTLQANHTELSPEELAELMKTNEKEEKSFLDERLVRDAIQTKCVSWLVPGQNGELDPSGC